MLFDRSKFLPLTLLAALTGVQALSLPAVAGQIKEHIYGDSFGNLIIYSPAGYKSIVVGQGYIADELAAAETARQPPVVHPEEKLRFRDCYYKPMFWRGRSRMYGLPDGVVPTPPRICR